MSDVKIEHVKKLREITGVGITDAKKALIEADGNFDKALEEMRKKGLASAAKRSDRETRAGLVGGYVHDGRIGVLVEVNCETDFVAKTDEFKELVKDLTLQIAASSPEDVKELLTQEFVKSPDQTISEILKQYIAKLGENINIRKFERIELGE